MNGVVFFHTLRRFWTSALGWGLGFAFIGFYTVAVVPNVDMLEQYASILDSMPPALMQMFGLGDSAALATPGGFLGFSFYGYMMLFFSAFGVISGLNIISNDEDRGITDVLFSLPLSRWQVLLERFLAFTVITALIALLATVGILFATTTTEIAYDAGAIVVASINMIPAVMVVMAFTALVTGITRRRAISTAAAAGFVIASYFINTLGSAASESAAAVLRGLSYFNYYDGGNTLLYGLNPVNFAVMLIFSFAALAIGVLAFQRRDVGA